MCFNSCKPALSPNSEMIKTFQVSKFQFQLPTVGGGQTKMGPDSKHTETQKGDDPCMIQNWCDVYVWNVTLTENILIFHI